MSDREEGEKEADPDAPEGEEEKPILTAEQKAELDKCFDIFDKDRDDHIEAKDLGTLLRSLNFNPTETELKELVQRFDKEQNLISRKNCLKIVE